MEDDRAVVPLEGDLDMACHRALEVRLLAAVAAGPTFTLDLGAVTFCDSMGLATLLKVHHAAELAGCRMTLQNVPAHMTRLFDVTGLDGQFDIL